MLIERRQFPVVSAEGITIHKSQGATYSKVALYLKRRITRAALYVACSRATTASGLFIVGSFVPLKPFAGEDPVNVELNRLKFEKLLRTYFGSMILRSSALQLYYHNVQSLDVLFRDIGSDTLLQTSEILCFVETWSLPTENYNLPNYTILHKIDAYEGCLREKRGISDYGRNIIQ